MSKPNEQAVQRRWDWHYPIMARAEGISEPLGDIVVGCNGAPVSTTGNLILFLTAGITNRVTADGLAPGVVLSVDGVPTGVTGRVSTQSITFTGVSFTVASSGAAALRVSGLRANLSQLGADNRQPVQAYISTTLGSLALGNNQVTVAMPARGLLATTAEGGIPCTGSPAPSSINMTALFAASTSFASTRVTEGFASAFRTRESGADSGARFLARYTGLPASAHVFVPDVVAGSNAVQPTGGGDLGLAPSGGQYAPGSNGSLLLSRVMGADANGAGGVPVYRPGAPGSGAVTLNNTSELPVVNGTAYVVYEVMDADSTQRESAQWPTFVALSNVNEASIARETIFFAPLSTDSAASAQAPLPRFAKIDPPSDCTALGDCESDVFPKLYVNAGIQQFSAIQGGAAMQGPGYISVQNTGGGLMSWTATISYKNGAGWLTLEPTSGINNGTVRVYPLTQNLTPGKYEATITIDGGVRAGSRSVSVVLLVTALPPANPPAPPAPPAAPKASISGLSNAADARMLTLAPGALATLRGANLAGKSVVVTFDGAAAKLLSASDTQLNVLVPPQLAGKESAQVVVTVDGVASAPATVKLAPAAPGIFANGVLNQDGSVNGDAASAPPGSVLQIFATGLPASAGGIVVKIHDREGLVPLYAGALAGADGVQQVNVAVPADLPAMETEVLVCAGQACSWPVKLVLR